MFFILEYSSCDYYL